MKSIIIPFIALAALSLALESVRAQIIASDDFSYSDGNLNGDNGGTGWAGPWVGNTYGTPTVAGGQAVINSSGMDAHRVVSVFQGSNRVSWLHFAAQQFTTASTGGTNNTFGGLDIYKGGTELGLIGKAWPGPYRWTLATIGNTQVSTQSTLSASVLYACITTSTTNTMTMDLWINPANPSAIDTVKPDATRTFAGSGWDSIYLRAGSGESVSESWKFDDLVVAGSLADLWGSPPSLSPPLLLAYEGFTNYLAGNLPGQALRGQGLGSGNWAGTSADAAAVTTSGGLSATYFVEYGGGKATVKGYGSDTWGQLDLGKKSAFRTAGLYDTNSGTIGGGKINGILYLSFLFRAISTDRQNEYGGLQLTRGTNSSTGVLIGNSTNAWAYSLYNPAVAMSIDLKNSGGAGSYLNMDNSTHLFVAKITYNGGFNDYITVWMDPDPALAETNQPSTTYTGTTSGDLSFDRFALRGGWNATGAPHPFDFDEIRFGTTWNTVLPPGPPPPQLTNSQIAVTFNNNGGIHSLAVLRGNVWETVPFRADGFAGPAWTLSDGSGTRSDPLTLTFPACGALTNAGATYTNVVFTGFDAYDTNLQIAMEYHLSSNRLAIIASITNVGTAVWAPVRAGILLGLDTYMASYPVWDYHYFPTLLRCEKTHFWGYAMTPLGRILGFASPDAVASWHNEYEGNGDRICTFGLDFLNRLPLPRRHPQTLTTLPPGLGMSWRVFVCDVPNNDPVCLDSILPVEATMASAPMIKASSYTGEPGDVIALAFWGNPVGGSWETPDGIVQPLSFVASNGMAAVGLTLPSNYGLCTLTVTNAAGRIAEASVNVRRPWSWYLQQARINALKQPQKDAGAQCEGYYGFYSMFLAKRWFPDAALDAQSDAKFNALYPLMFSTTTGLPTYNTWRIQNSAAMAGVLADRYSTDGNITNLNRAAALCDFLLDSQRSNGGYYSGGSDYSSVLYPGKSIMEVMALERALGLTNGYWQRKYTNHYNSVGRAMDHLALNLDDIGTEGEAAFEDGMISCSGAQLGMYALLQTNAIARKKYLRAAAWFESAHRCLDQIVVPDARSNGGTERFWEDQFDIIATPDLMCSPHGWSAWNIYGRWYLYQLTGNVEYLRQAMNALGACTQLIDSASGNLCWAFCTDPFIPAIIFTNNPSNTNPNTQGTRIAQTVGEQYLPMISGWCRAPQGTQVSEYSGHDGGCNDNDVHEIFKCLGEVALTSAYVVINADGSCETWNCQAVRTNSTLLVTPSESIVSQISVNASVSTSVSLNFNGQIVTRLLTGIDWQQAPPANDAYHVWRQAWFGTNYAANPNTLDAADYDHDGLPNLLEYLLGTDPTVPTTMPLPIKVQVNGEAYYQWEIPINPVAAPAVPQIQDSPDLRHWTVPTSVGDGNVIIEQGINYRLVKLRAGAFPACFFRIAGPQGQ